MFLTSNRCKLFTLDDVWNHLVEKRLFEPYARELYIDKVTELLHSVRGVKSKGDYYFYRSMHCNESPGCQDLVLAVNYGV